MKNTKIISLVTIIVLILCLTACGSKTLKSAQEAYDAGNYEQVIQIINDSDESISENQDLRNLYVDAYTKIAYSKIDDKQPREAFRLFEDMQKDNLLGQDELKEGYYAVGKSFEAEKQYAAAGLSFAKATGYSDADEQSKINWDKGAYRDTISVNSYTAVGIKPDGTIATALNDEYIESRKGKKFENVSIGAFKLEGIDWKNIVSIATNDQYIVGLTDEGTVLIYDTGYHFLNSKRDIDTSEWKDIVAIDFNGDMVVGLDKSGKIHISGRGADEYKEVEKWENIIDVNLGWDCFSGVDIYGNAHVLWDQLGNYIDLEDGNELSKSDVVQFSCTTAFGVFITKDGNLRTTVTPESAKQISFKAPSMPETAMNPDEFKGFDAQGGSKFVQCEAGYMNYVGLLSDGAVKVGGDMGDLLASFGADKWKDISEVHIGIDDLNPVIVGVTSDGSIKLAGFEGGDFIPFHDRIRAWGKLKKPTREF